jgi:tetratricopeptide (TPR) repeat protein
MRLIASLFAAFAVLFSLPAKAIDWYVVETEHFIIYTKDSEEAAVQYGKDVERLDQALRIVSGVGMDTEAMSESSKVVVYRFGETRDMGRLLGNRFVGGFFRPDATGSVAFVPRRETISREKGFADARYKGTALPPKGVMFHEYVHYFMYHHRDAPYPFWYSEGFAEVFATLRIEEDGFVLGEVPSWRSVPIMDLDIDLEDMFAPGEKPSREYGSRAYAHGWLLSNYLNLTPERRTQIGPYLQAIYAGEEPLKAAKDAFGDIEQLEKELDDYRKGRARLIKFPFLVKEEPKVSVRKMTEDEEARMDLAIRSKAGVDEKQAARQVSDARKLVSEYPQSVPVLLAATEVEFDNKNWDEAEQLAARAMEIDPNAIDAAIYHARVALMRAFEDPSNYAVARDRFAKANNLMPDHPYPLYGYYMSFELAGEEAPEDARLALEQAFALGPYDTNIRFALAHLLAKEERYGPSVSLLRRFTIGAGKTPIEMSACYDQANAGDSSGLLEMLKPDHPLYEDEVKWTDKSDEEKYPCLTKAEAV